MDCKLCEQTWATFTRVSAFSFITPTRLRVSPEGVYKEVSFAFDLFFWVFARMPWMRLSNSDPQGEEHF